MKVLIGILAALAIGFFIGRETGVPVTRTIVTDTPNLENLQRVVDFDLQDYYRLKSSEERYKKADEILGKMLTIFLADLGMKISRPPQVGQTQAAAETKATPPSSLPVAAEAGKAAVNVNPKQPAPIARMPLSDLRSPNDISDFLKASQLDHFEDAIKSSTGFMNRNGQLENLSGRFVGTAQIISKGEPEQWGVEMSLSAKISAGKLTGRRSLKLSRNGKVFSDSSGNGGLDEDYREISSDPEAVIVAAGPNTFLQTYYVRNTDQVIGSVMRKEGLSGPYKSIGFFELNRR